MRFRDAVDAFDRLLGGVEDALEAGDTPVLPAFDDTKDLEGPINADDISAYERVMVRLAACTTRIQMQRVSLLEEVSTLDRRRKAAHAYAVNGAR